jgi:acyl-CoA thioesterase II
MDITDVLRLEPGGTDVWTGAGPQYDWGGLYGGQIVAQALSAAAESVDAGFFPHSVRSYFIRPGDHTVPVRYEVDRPRDGKSFCTRRVIARQAIGAILNGEASFTRAEDSPSVEPFAGEDRGGPDDALPEVSWTTLFERRFVEGTDASGRARAWFRAMTDLGDDPLVHACALAFISDDLPTDSVVRAHPGARDLHHRDDFHRAFFTASLDHTIWFHRPLRVDEWHLHDFSCHSLSNGRGLAIGHVFALDGTHAATVAQEVLLREARA